MKKVKQKKRGLSFGKKMIRDWQLWVMLLIPITWLLLFRYWPLFGILISFQNYKVGSPFWGEKTKWVGFKWFVKFFENPYCWRYIRNTLAISLLGLAINFPMGIILALLFNEIRNKKFRSFTSSVSILPHFISVVVIVGMLRNIFSLDGGLVNNFLNKLGLESIDFMGSADWFRPLYIGSGTWSGSGYAAIVYTAAIAGIDPSLYEAATVDGASRWKQIFHITLPGILPTIVTMLILRVGTVMSVGYEKVFLLQTGSNMEVSDVLSTYTYRMGILDGQTSYAAAIGLFNSVINLLLVLGTNKLSKKLTDNGLW